MKRKILLGFLLISLLALPVLGAGCGGDDTTTTTTTTASRPADYDTREKIIIGAARPISGDLAFFEENAFGPLYKMWVDEINAKGGIYVEEYDKRLPVEMKVYDDKSDMSTMTRLLEKLITEDEVDFVFAPASTAFYFAAAAVTDKYDYILFSGEGGATTIRDMVEDMPYFFGILNFSDWNQIPVLADVMEEVGVQTVAIVYLEDLHGLEYHDVSMVEFEKKGFDVVMEESIPLGIQDMSPILKQAQALNPDALLIYAYPDQNFLAVGQMVELGYNPNMLLLGPGGNFAAFQAAFGDAIIDGVMGEGAWNTKSSQALSDFYDRFIAAGNDPAQLDWWGHAFYYAGLQIFEQAIEKAGTLDQAAIREVLVSQHFDTVLGDTWFDNQLLAVECHPGQIGQWQDGIFEVIDPGDKRTADPIYPKPDWPAAE